MNIKNSILSIAILLLLFHFSGWSGTLDTSLQEQITRTSSNELIPVWIKLPRTIPVKQLKAEVHSLAATRQERHAAVIDRLKSNNLQSQRNVLAKLRQLKQQGMVSQIKTHWLGNIIEAQVAAGQLATLADRSDIDMIYPVPKITLIEPLKADALVSEATAGVEPNLQFIRADSAWKMGYTGAGRIICSFDSGIEGDHPALAENWKGLDGDSAAAWFDPRDGESFPHTISGSSSSHGTHVMGILVGHDDAAGDTIGVAPEAKWISAAVIDIPGASIIDAFEWAADPDGDPNTVADVPDVVNHSWGVANIGCMNVFYDLIDNLEALGIVNVFAAGNEGPGAQTLRNPANRALDSLDCFAAGAIVLGTPPTIWTSSSRGPSDCNGAVKPNVTAPGQAIRSSVPGYGYLQLSGTSMAAPHVAGLVALLRQKNPNATVDEIKTAILTSALDHGYSLPNNDFGWGVIDCVSALNALSSSNSSPNVRMYAFDHAPIAPGATVSGTVVLQNIGSTVTGVSATITGSNPSLTVLNGSAFFGTIAEGDTVRSSDIIRVIVSDTITEGSVLSLDFTITGDGAYQKAAKLYFIVEPPTKRMMATHSINNIEFTVSNYGTYGMGPNSFFPAGGVGFTFNGSINDLYESGLIIGTGVNSVSDGVRNAIGEPDGDFAVSPGGNMQFYAPGTIADEETYAVFSDSRAESPIGLQITQQSFAFQSAPNDNSIILRYIITNTNPFPVTNIHVGVYNDWDLISYSLNAGGWDNTDSLIWMAYNNGTTLSRYRGMKVLDGPLASAWTTTGATVSYPEGLTEVEKYNALTDSFGSATTYANARLDLVQLLTVGPILLSPGQADTVAFAYLAGDSLSDLASAASNVSAIYDTLISQQCCKGMRGNVDGVGGDEPNVADVTYLVSFLWQGGSAPPCPEEANIDGTPTGDIDVADLTYLVATLWQGGPTPLLCSEIIQ